MQLAVRSVYDLQEQSFPGGQSPKAHSTMKSQITFTTGLPSVPSYRCKGWFFTTWHYLGTCKFKKTSFCACNLILWWWQWRRCTDMETALESAQCNNWHNTIYNFDRDNSLTHYLTQVQTHQTLTQRNSLVKLDQLVWSFIQLLHLLLWVKA